jgi:membrane protease subunit HflK
MSWDKNGGNQNPWGGGGGGGPRGGGGGQPPDIDELIRQGQQKLKSFLPGGGGKSTIFLGLLVILLLWIATGFYSVQPSQQGVVLRFGEWTETTTPGLRWHIPYPVETVLLPNVTAINRIDIGFRSEPVVNRRGRQQTNFLNESLMLTGDENIVDIEFTVFWRLDDAGKYLFNIQNPQELTIKVVAESAMREVIGRTPIERALTEDRGIIQREVQDLIQTVLDSYGSGVRITELKLERVDPPEQVIEAFRDVQAAEADRERFQNQAQAYANSIVPEARGQSQKMILEAEAYKAQVVARAQGEASRFLSVYKEYAQAKDVTRRRMYLETMQEILTGMNKVILDDSVSGGVVPYLPLPELKTRNNSGRQ